MSNFNLKRFNDFCLNNKENFTLTAIFLLLLLATGLLPLIDPSESRYASIAQRMVISNNWLVPEINRGAGFMPFWGKPPLHIWMTALSMKIFGFSEFAARLPSFLSLCLIVLLCIKFARNCLSSITGRIFPFLVTTSPVFLLLSLSCIIDASFCLWVTLSLVSFALTIQTEKKFFWNHLFFIALGFGFLTKGPLILLITGFVLSSWILLNRNWSDLNNFSWIRGACLFFLIALPWFFFADQRTPGFLNYFFVNENFERYTSDKYIDLYGSSHRTFRGMIILYFFTISFPLILLFFSKLLNPHAIKKSFGTNKWYSYLLLWASAPIAVFLPSNNVLITYTLPGLPALFLLCSESLRFSSEKIIKVFLYIYPTLFIVLSTVGIIAWYFEPSNLFIFASLGLLLVLLYKLGSIRNELILKGLCTSLGCMLIGVWVIYTTTPFLNDNFSTKKVVLALDDYDRSQTISFYDKLPYSALFYLQSIKSSRNNLPVVNQLDAEFSGDLIINHKKINKLSKKQLSLIEEDSSTKNWIVVDTDQDHLK